MMLHTSNGPWLKKWSPSSDLGSGLGLLKDVPHDSSGQLRSEVSSSELWIRTLPGSY